MIIINNMLKLKDIFNIDISSKGGGKLYKKIMRKYNIPLKDVKEVKQEIVECSSGGGENIGQIEYLYIKLNDLSYRNNQIDVGYKIVSIITYKYDTLVQKEYKYHLNMFQAIARLGIDTSIKILAIRLIKINEDGCDATSLAAIVEKYPNWSVCEEITEEEFNSLL